MLTFYEDNNPNYPSRTIKNVCNSDCTIAFAVDFNTRGEVLTKRICGDKRKPYFALDLNNLNVTQERINKLVNCLNSLNGSEITINIAGNGIYTPHMTLQEAIDEFIYLLMKKVLSHKYLTKKIVKIVCGGQSGVDEAGAKAGMKLGIDVTVLAPKGFMFKDKLNNTWHNEKKFKERFIL